MEPTALATAYPFSGGKWLIAVRGTGAGRAGAGRRQERRPGRGPCRARGAERAALEPVKKVVTQASSAMRHSGASYCCGRLAMRS